MKISLFSRVESLLKLSVTYWVFVMFLSTVPYSENRPIKKIVGRPSQVNKFKYSSSSMYGQINKDRFDKRHESVNTKLNRMYQIVGRSQCKLKMDSNGFVYGRRAELPKTNFSITDDDFWFLPVAPGFVFIQSASTNRWLCVRGRNIIGQQIRDSHNCLFKRHRSVVAARHLQWDHVGLSNSAIHLRVAWFPSMGSFCSAQAVNVSDWNEVKHPDFFAFLTVQSQQPDLQHSHSKNIIQSNSLNRSYFMLSHFAKKNISRYKSDEQRPNSNISQHKLIENKHPITTNVGIYRSCHRKHGNLNCNKTLRKSFFNKLNDEKHDTSRVMRVHYKAVDKKNKSQRAQSIKNVNPKTRISHIQTTNGQLKPPLSYYRIRRVRFRAKPNV